MSVLRMTHQASLLHELPLLAAERTPHAVALRGEFDAIDYAGLASAIERFAGGLAAVGVARGQRVAVYLDKRPEFVVAAFGVTHHGAVFVPINPLLKPDQLGYILRDCSVQVLVTSRERLGSLTDVLNVCPDLAHVVVTPAADGAQAGLRAATHGWNDWLSSGAPRAHRIIDHDVAAILYTSGSTGKPKGVVLSHRNMVAGAKSVASYLGNHDQDVILAALPLSFDAGLSQLTTGFHVGAAVVLLNYLLPKDVVKAMAAHRVTGLTAVPPLWIQLTQVSWPPQAIEALRYFANTGGRMPLETLNRLRATFPAAKPFLMYGLTEAFRATYLPPEEVDRRPDSIGKAIPNSEVLVLREDGSECAADEPGELVQRGALVALGYWNDPAKTAERFKPLPGRATELVLPEVAVFSGDTVRRDSDGFLYFIGRRDEMIKSSGYRISPTEVEEIVYATQLVGECAAFGIQHDALGEAVVVVATPLDGQQLSSDALLRQCRERLPVYMVPSRIEIRSGSLPRNANGKIDRKSIAAEFARRDLSA